MSDIEKPHYAELYLIKSSEEFERDLDLLLKHFDPISLEELLNLVSEGKKPKKPVFHLTFDDGLQEFYRIVAPILKRRSIPATFFVNTDFIDNNDVFYRFKASVLADQYAAKGAMELVYSQHKDLDELCSILGLDMEDYLKVQQPYLTKTQIQELIDDGFTIGAHSKNHPIYSALNLEEQLDQTLGSLEHLVETFNLDYKVFSFPFTDDGVSKAFYQQINDKLELTFGTAGVKSDVSRKNLQRIPMENDLDSKRLLKYHYFKATVQKLIGNNKIKR